MDNVPFVYQGTGIFRVKPPFCINYFRWVVNIVSHHSRDYPHSFSTITSLLSVECTGLFSPFEGAVSWLLSSLFLVGPFPLCSCKVRLPCCTHHLQTSVSLKLDMYLSFIQPEQLGTVHVSLPHWTHTSPSGSSLSLCDSKLKYAFRYSGKTSYSLPQAKDEPFLVRPSSLFLLNLPSSWLSFLS